MKLPTFPKSGAVIGGATPVTLTAAPAAPTPARDRSGQCMQAGTTLDCDALRVHASVECRVLTRTHRFYDYAYSMWHVHVYV